MNHHAPDLVNALRVGMSMRDLQINIRCSMIYRPSYFPGIPGTALPTEDNIGLGYAI